MADEQAKRKPIEPTTADQKPEVVIVLGKDARRRTDLDC